MFHGFAMTVATPYVVDATSRITKGHCSNHKSGDLVEEPNYWWYWGENPEDKTNRDRRHVKPDTRYKDNCGLCKARLVQKKDDDVLEPPKEIRKQKPKQNSGDFLDITQMESV